jgi:hypothetical protein
MEALSHGGLVVSAGPLCSVGREAFLHQNSEAWSLGFTCMCGSRKLALSSHGAAKQAGINHLVLTMQQRPWGLLVLGCGLPGAMATTTGMGDPSLQAAGVLGPACQVLAATGVGEQESQEPQESLENNACGQQESWGLLARAGYQEPKLLLQAWGTQACGQREH